MKLYWLTLIAYGLFTSQFVYAADDADETRYNLGDTEIYLGGSRERINPNVVFVFDTSGSMIADTDGNVPAATNLPSRLDITKAAARQAIQNLYTSGNGVNISIMRFTDRKGSGGTTAQGGYLLTPALDISKQDNLNTVLNAINSLHGAGGTPMVESVYEAGLYLRGDTPKYGKLATGNSYERATAIYSPYQDCTWWTWWTWWSCQTKYSYKHVYDTVSGRLPNSHADSLDGDSYKSPITHTCQSNHIVLFTDGLPSSDGDANSDIRNLIKNMSNLPNGLDKDCEGNGGCAEELAYWLQHGNTKDGSTKQEISVHTVGGFNVEETANKMLENMALHGEGIFQVADDEDKLASALNVIFGSISDRAGNFAAPAVAVNSFNSLEHRDELYYSVFQPAKSPGWSGNIKRYRMNSSGEILDVNGNSAVNPDTGFFKDNAKSFWSTEVDGPIVTKGGIASRLGGERKVYTNVVPETIIHRDNRIHEDNKNNITIDKLTGNLPDTFVMTEAEQIKALQWGRGLDPATQQPRRTLADPLHGTPLLVTYRENTAIKDVLYAGTNSGYIHAFDPDKDYVQELWAFMPKELLPNLAVYQSGLARYEKVYGIDGPMSVYHKDTNKDRIIDSGETAYLTAGMRRGGSHYYLLDISSRNNPKLEAQISAGNDGFEELGQTWSRMMPANVHWNGKKIPVFFFGGGYDPIEDTKTTRGNTATKGNAVYMVSADSSATSKPFELLWKATGRTGNLKGITNTNMKSGFAGDLSLVDNDGDGTVDLVYGADVGGRIWRFDINKDNTGANDFATEVMLADFNNDTVAGNIRFYTQPDISYTEYGKIEIKDPTGTYILQTLGRYQIVIGSGFRARPLSKAVNDKIFVINDYDTEKAPMAGYNTLKITDLADYQSFATTTPEKRYNGFYYDLPGDGEKVLSTTMTVNDVIYVPTFRPSDANREIGCEPDTGQARLIVLKPASNPYTTERIVIPKDLKQGGIVPKPVLIFPPTDPDNPGPVKPIIAIGTETTEPEGDFNAFQKTYWRQN